VISSKKQKENQRGFRKYITKQSLLLVTVAGICLALYYAFSADINQLVRHILNAGQSYTQNDEIQEIMALGESNPAEAEKKAVEYIQSLPDNSKLSGLYRLGVEGSKTDVKFVGRVLDQYDNPVKQAKIVYIISGQLLASGAGQGITYTDDQGKFIIEGKGAAVTVQHITGDHIDYNPPTPDVEHSLSDGRNPSVKVVDWYNYTDSDPYTYRVWRVESYGQVISGRTGYPLPPTGEVYTFNPLLSRDKQWVRGESPGIMRFSCERGPMSDRNDYQDWRIIIRPVDGGILSTQDLYMNLAPESGYESQHVIEQVKSAKGYRNKMADQRYFFNANNNRYYGAIVAEYWPHFRINECEVLFSYRINTEGKRGLAIKPQT
jgi:hypothetical protein